MAMNSTRHSTSNANASLNSTFANKYKLAADLFCLNIGSSNNAAPRYSSKIGDKIQSALYQYGGTSDPVEAPIPAKYEAYNPL